MAGTSTANSAKIEYNFAASEKRDAIERTGPNMNLTIGRIGTPDWFSQRVPAAKASVWKFDGDCLNARSLMNCN
jgi:hypothetical protein